MLKTSLIYLLAALLVGVLQAAQPLMPAGAVGLLARVEPVRVHLLVVGWLTLLIFGVAFWMFPKFNQASPRGYDWLGWATYGLLNAGLLLRVFFEGAVRPGSNAGWLLVLSAGLQWLAALAFCLNTWPRIKEK